MGEPVVILPGLICDGRMFDAQRCAFDAIVINGHYGEADRISGMARHAIDRLPDGCALLGHSMGARVALEIWRLAPQKVARLALANTGVHPQKPGEREARYALRDQGRAQGDAALVDKWLPPMIGKAHRQDAELFTRLHAMATDPGTAIFERQIAALLNRPDARAVLSTINCPAFIIAGRDDEWSPVRQHEEIAANIPGAQLRVIEDAGHMAPAEEPDRFNDVLGEWLLADRGQAVMRRET